MCGISSRCKHHAMKVYGELFEPTGHSTGSSEVVSQLVACHFTDCAIPAYINANNFQLMKMKHKYLFRMCEFSSNWDRVDNLHVCTVHQ